MKVLIADDHQLLRDTLSSFLAQQPDMQIKTAADVAQAMAAISAAPRFDLVLLDYDMPGMAALEGLQAILAGPNAPPVALISGIAPPDMVERAFQMGIRGFLHKAMPATSLLHAIRFMALGERFIPVEFLAEAGIGFGQGRAEAESEGAKLTAREVEVLRALCDGMTNKQIARDLELKEPTVKLHVKTLYRRLGVSNRTQAAMVARTRGLC
jgi:two-component system, NarL family, nitrate/nitrite response regulator NarL